MKRMNILEVIKRNYKLSEPIHKYVYKITIIKTHGLIHINVSCCLYVHFFIRNCLYMRVF